MPHAFQLSKRRPDTFRLLAGLALVSAVGGGCVTDGYYRHRPQATAPADTVIPRHPGAPRTLVMYEGETGRPSTWADLIEGLGWADVILIGEIHDHPAGHAVELAIVEDTLSSFPGSAVSMEMFERPEQATVDAYLAGTIDAATLVEQTGSRSWAPKDPALGSWESFYQPIVDAAKRAGSPVIAANAPREYVRQARTDGYAALAALPAAERAMFDLPSGQASSDYRARFDEVMTPDGAEPQDPQRQASLDRTFRAQQVWDATMARSIAAALDDGASKVVHLAGAFHVDFDGGIVQQLRAAKPFVRILTVTVVPVDSRVLREEDRNRADMVLYAPYPPAAEPDTAAPDDASPAPAEAPAEVSSSTAP
jgi:uncharacterized iron-regulated protein